MRSPILASAICAALLVLPPPASAAGKGAASTLEGPGGLYDAGPQQRENVLSFFGSLPWFAGVGLGLGGRYMIPVVPEGFIGEINDSFEIELGADLWYAYWRYSGIRYGYLGVAAPVGEMSWTFHFTKRFSSYVKLGLGWYWGFGNSSFSVLDSAPGGLFPVGGVGVNYKLSNDKMTLRAELANEGLKLGLGFDI
jgi:hypothetical protein